MAIITATSKAAKIMRRIVIARKKDGRGTNTGRPMLPSLFKIDFS